MTPGQIVVAVLREVPADIRWLLTWRRGDIAAWGRLSQEERYIARLFDLRATRVESKHWRLRVEAPS